MTDELSTGERQAVEKAFQRVSEQGWGLAIGFLAALALFLATVVLVMKGGPHPGPHLGLLRIYLPGYSVTWLGAFIGAGYAFFIGYGVGRTIGTVYNKLV